MVVEISSMEEIVEITAEVTLIVDGATVSVNIILVGSMIDIVNDGVIIDGSTGLVVLLIEVLNVTVKDGVKSMDVLVKVGVNSIEDVLKIVLVLETTTILSLVLKVCVSSTLAVAVKLNAALLILTSVVCKLILELSVAIVDETIGRLDRGDIDDKVVVKDMLGVTSLKLRLVKNPLPSGSEVNSPLPINSDVIRLEDVTTLLILVGNNNVEANKLVSIPLPGSSSLFTLL